MKDQTITYSYGIWDPETCTGFPEPTVASPDLAIKAFTITLLFKERFQQTLAEFGEEAGYEAWDASHTTWRKSLHNEDEYDTVTIHLLRKAGDWSNYHHLAEIPLEESRIDLEKRARAAAAHLVANRVRSFKQLKHQQASCLEIDGANQQRRLSLLEGLKQEELPNPFS